MATHAQDSTTLQNNIYPLKAQWEHGTRVKRSELRRAECFSIGEYIL